MGDERLSHLTLMNIENDLLSSLNFDDLIDEFSNRKARKKSL